MPKHTKTAKKEVLTVTVGKQTKTHHYDPSNVMHVAAMRKIGSTLPTDKQKEMLLRKVKDGGDVTFDDLMRLITVMDNCNKKMVAAAHSDHCVTHNELGQETHW